MQLEEIHQQVDDKLEKLDEEIERFESNIETSDDAEQRALLEQDLNTLHVIRDKLLKARSLAQQVTDLREEVENPQEPGKGINWASPQIAVAAGTLAVAVAFAIWWFLQN